MARTVSWIHISDFHLKDGDIYEQKTVLDALIHAIEYDRQQGTITPDFVIASGDIAHSGMISQYEHATAFFDDVLIAANIDKSRLFIIPGNHDVTRHKALFIRRTLDSFAESTLFFGPDGDVEDYYNKRLGAYCQWHDQYFEGARTLSKTTTCQSPVILNIRDANVAITLINSCLFSQGEDDNGKLWIGRRCLEEATRPVAKANPALRLAIIHHPLEWLHEIERSNITTLLRDNYDVILRGHLHTTDVEGTAGVHGDVLTMASGASYQGSQYPNRALYVFCDIETGNIRVHPIRYEDNPRTVWTLDPSVYPFTSTHEHVYHIALKGLVPPSSSDDGGG